MQSRLSLQGRLAVLVLAATAPVAAVSAWAHFALGSGFFAATLLALLSGLALAAWYGRRFVVKPTRQILGAVHRIEGGQLDARVPLLGRPARGEFARIGSAFNLMAESLQRRQHELESELGRSRSAYAVLDTVMNSMQEGVIAVDRNGRFLMTNRAAANLFPVEGAGAPPVDWVAAFGLYQPGTEALYPGEQTPLARAMHGEEGDMLVQVRNRLVPQGRLLRCNYCPLHDVNGVAGGLLVFTDVTALERAEANLLQHLREFSAMLQRTAEAAQAITRNQALGRTLQEVADQSRRVIGAHYAAIRLVAADGDATGPYWTRSASERYPAGEHPAKTEARLIVPLVNGRDEAIGELELADKYQGSFSDRDEYVAIELAQLASIAIENARLFGQVHELNAGLEARIAQRTAELVRQGRLYRTLAEQAPEVVWNTDASGTQLTFLNRAWYDLVGGTEADWIGRSGLGAIHPDDRAAVSANWRRSRDTLSTFTGIRRLRARDGSYHTMSYKGAPVFDENGEVAFWVGIDSDITELKAIEEALRTSNAELEAFSYSVSHDLRSPLGAIDGFSRALAGRLESHPDAKVQHYLSRIQAGVGRMEQLIEALLGLSRVAREPLHPETVDLAALARESLEALQAAEPGRSVATHVADGLLVQGDARLLRILVENLLGNAWKFTSKAPEPCIEVGRDEADGSYFVRDNGVGFEMAYAGKLFSAFQRLHTEAEFPGTGIGLATVRRIVSRHRGRVWAESAPGQGTTIRFTLAG
ncbi:MAG: PAS domain S-box protein [Burkholderiales bacterium]|nr:PAS domain S-box protein [Burkholderiales bacterium]